MLTLSSFKKYDLAPDDAVVIAFNLVATGADATSERVRMYGWIQPRGKSPAKIIVTQGKNSETFAANEARPDVVERLGGKASVNCGFQFLYSPSDDSPIEIFAASSKARRLIGRIELGEASPAAAVIPAAPAQPAVPSPSPSKPSTSPYKDLTEISSGPAPVSHKAVRGKNDFLFLGGADSNGLIEHMSGKTAITQAALDIHAHNFAVIDALKIPHLVVVVPEAHIVYEDLLPAGVTVSSDRPIRALLERHGKSVWYPLEMMRDLRAKGQVVYTGHDSHWSEYASFPVYEGMRRRIGRDFQMVTALTPSHVREVKDLRIVSREEVVARETEARKTALGSLYRIFFSVGILNHGNMSALFNPAGKGRLLAFGTSFSTRLVPAYASDFREVIFCYGTTVDPLLIDMVRPDAVLVEMPERFVHFPSLAIPGCMLMSSLIASRAEGYRGPSVDNLNATPEHASDVVQIARDLVMSGKEPERLKSALKLLTSYSTSVAGHAASIASVLPQVSNPSAFRSVVAGQYMNSFVLNTVWQAIDQGELQGADPGIFPETEMGLLARMRLDLRSGRKDQARLRLAHFVPRFAKSDFVTRMNDVLATS